MGVKINTRGLFDWIVQRTTAVIIGVYVIFMLGFVICHQPLQYSVWHQLFSHLFLKIITLVVVVSVLWHAWIGLWTVFTDYVKCSYARLLLEIIVLVALLGYLIWCIDALWS